MRASYELPTPHHHTDGSYGGVAGAGMRQWPRTIAQLPQIYRRSTHASIHLYVKNPAIDRPYYHWHKRNIMHGLQGSNLIRFPHKSKAITRLCLLMLKPVWTLNTLQVKINKYIYVPIKIFP